MINFEFFQQLKKSLHVDGNVMSLESCDRNDGEIGIFSKPCVIMDLQILLSVTRVFMNVSAKHKIETNQLIAMILFFSHNNLTFANT